MRTLQRGRGAGIVVVVLAAALAGSAPGSASAPANDHLEDAHPLGGLPTHFAVDMLGSTMQPGEPTCRGTAGSVWYTVTPSLEVLHVDVDGWDAGVGLYEGSSIAGLVRVACFVAPAGPNRVLVQPGRTYLLQVTYTWTNQNVVDVELWESPRAPNDLFADATEIASLPFDAVADLPAAFGEPGERNPCGWREPPQASVWYSFTAPRDMLVAFAVGSVAATAVYTGPSLDDLELVACDEPYSEYPDGLWPVALRADVTYRVQVAWVWSYIPPDTSVPVAVHEPLPPPNDDRADAMPASPPFRHVLATTLGATVEADEPQAGLPGCPDLGATVWYSVRVDAPTVLEVRTRGDYYWWDAGVAVYADAPDGIVPVACSDDAMEGVGFPCLFFCDPGGDPYDPGSHAAFLAVPGTTYLVQAGGNGGATGPLEITISELGREGGTRPVAASDGDADCGGLPACAAVSARGNATCSAGICAAASGTGGARGTVAFSAAGPASGPVAASVAGDCNGVRCFAVEPDGDARGRHAAVAGGSATCADAACVSVGGADASWGLVAASTEGDARGGVAVARGDATGIVSVAAEGKAACLVACASVTGTASCATDSACVSSGSAACDQWFAIGPSACAAVGATGNTSCTSTVWRESALRACAAASGTGASDCSLDAIWYQACAAASAAGDATCWVRGVYLQACAAATATGNAACWAGGPWGQACLATSGTGAAECGVPGYVGEACVAASGAGDATCAVGGVWGAAVCVAVTPTGDATCSATGTGAVCVAASPAGRASCDVGGFGACAELDVQRFLDPP